MTSNDDPPSLVERSLVFIEQPDLKVVHIPKAYTIQPLELPEKLIRVMAPPDGKLMGIAAVTALPVSRMTESLSSITSALRTWELTTTDGPVWIDPLLLSRTPSGFQEVPPSDVRYVAVRSRFSVIKSTGKVPIESD